jgi:hypothetical protein
LTRLDDRHGAKYSSLHQKVQTGSYLIVGGRCIIFRSLPYNVEVKHLLPCACMAHTGSHFPVLVFPRSTYLYRYVTAAHFSSLPALRTQLLVGPSVFLSPPVRTRSIYFSCLIQQVSYTCKTLQLRLHTALRVCSNVAQHKAVF